jgi:hypothetical protein
MAQALVNVQSAYHDGSSNYIVTQNFGTLPDTGLAPTISKLRIFENGIELGPSHATHADIRTLGGGRFSHWGGSSGTGASQLYFSTSDNTDPRQNGRIYTYVIDSQLPSPPSPIALAIGISVPAGSTLPASGTTMVVISFTSGTPTSVTLARGSLTAFGQWPTGALSQYFTRTASGLTFNLCLTPTCVPSGPVTLKATAIDANGQSASASTSITIGSTTPPPTVQLKTDLGVYYEPPLPAMGPAGSRVTDPTFGTKILRVTDGADGNSNCFVPYSYYQTFNSNGTRLYFHCRTPNNTIYWADFDPVNFVVSNRRKATGVPWGVLAHNMKWSGTNPNVIYGHNGTSIYSYNFGTNTWTQIKSSLGVSLDQMSMSRDTDDVFAFSWIGHNGYVVWRRSTNTILINRADAYADEVHTDPSGLWLDVVQTTGNVPIWSLGQTTASLTTTLTRDVDGYAHQDQSSGHIFSSTPGGGLAYRSFSTPHSYTSILLGWFKFTNINYSMNADNVTWALVWVQRNDTLSNTRPFENELFQVATDGSNRVRRIAHHRSKWNEYYDQPNANISRDGQFVAFTSNWGNATGRRDVYLVQLPPAPTE